LKVQMIKRTVEVVKDERGTMQRDMKAVEIRVAQKAKDETEWEIVHLKLACTERLVGQRHAVQTQGENGHRFSLQEWKEVCACSYLSQCRDRKDGGKDLTRFCRLR